MDTAATTTSPVTTDVWLRRLRFCLAVAVVWGLLHYVAGRFVLPPGVDRPPVLVGSFHGPLAGLVVVIVLWLGAAIAAPLLATRQRRLVLMTLGLGLALWTWEGGQLHHTMDSWLRMNHSQPTGPTSGPYWMLVGDYLYLLLALGGAYIIAGLFGAQPAAGSAWPARLFDDWPNGLKATLITAAVAGVVASVLLLPLTEWTRRGQVCFAVGLGFVAGVYAARQFSTERRLHWYAAAPLLLGLVGVVVAAISPALMIPENYRNLDQIPAWPLARPLPVEMVGVGLLIALWMLGAPAEPDKETAA